MDLFTFSGDIFAFKTFLKYCMMRNNALDNVTPYARTGRGTDHLETVLLNERSSPVLGQIYRLNFVLKFLIKAFGMKPYLTHGRPNDML